MAGWILATASRTSSKLLKSTVTPTLQSLMLAPLVSTAAMKIEGRQVVMNLCQVKKVKVLTNDLNITNPTGTYEYLSIFPWFP